MAIVVVQSNRSIASVISQAMIFGVDCEKISGKNNQVELTGDFSKIAEIIDRTGATVVSRVG